MLISISFMSYTCHCLIIIQLQTFWTLQNSQVSEMEALLSSSTDVLLGPWALAWWGAKRRGLCAVFGQAKYTSNLPSVLRLLLNPTRHDRFGTKAKHCGYNECSGATTTWWASVEPPSDVCSDWQHGGKVWIMTQIYIFIQIFAQILLFSFFFSFVVRL